MSVDSIPRELKIAEEQSFKKCIKTIIDLKGQSIPIVHQGLFGLLLCVTTNNPDVLSHAYNQNEIGGFEVMISELKFSHSEGQKLAFIIACPYVNDESFQVKIFGTLSTATIFSKKIVKSLDSQFKDWKNDLDKKFNTSIPEKTVTCENDVGYLPHWKYLCVNGEMRTLGELFNSQSRSLMKGQNDYTNLITSHPHLQPVTIATPIIKNQKYTIKVVKCTDYIDKTFVACNRKIMENYEQVQKKESEIFLSRPSSQKEPEIPAPMDKKTKDRIAKLLATPENTKNSIGKKMNQILNSSDSESTPSTPMVSVQGKIGIQTRAMKKSSEKKKKTKGKKLIIESDEEEEEDDVNTLQKNRNEGKMEEDIEQDSDDEDHSSKKKRKNLEQEKSLQLNKKKKETTSTSSSPITNFEDIFHSRSVILDGVSTITTRPERVNLNANYHCHECKDNHPKELWKNTQEKVDISNLYWRCPNGHDLCLECIQKKLGNLFEKIYNSNSTRDEYLSSLTKFPLSCDAQVDASLLIRDGVNINCNCTIEKGVVYSCIQNSVDEKFVNSWKESYVRFSDLKKYIGFYNNQNTYFVCSDPTCTTLHWIDFRSANFSPNVFKCEKSEHCFCVCCNKTFDHSEKEKHQDCVFSKDNPYPRWMFLDKFSRSELDSMPNWTTSDMENSSIVSMAMLLECGILSIGLNNCRICLSSSPKCTKLSSKNSSLLFDDFCTRKKSTTEDGISFGCPCGFISCTFCGCILKPQHITPDEKRRVEKYSLMKMEWMNESNTRDHLKNCSAAKKWRLSKSSSLEDFKERLEKFQKRYPSSFIDLFSSNFQPILSDLFSFVLYQDQPTTNPDDFIPPNLSHIRESINRARLRQLECIAVEPNRTLPMCYGQIYMENGKKEKKKMNMKELSHYINQPFEINIYQQNAPQEEIGLDALAGAVSSITSSTQGEVDVSQFMAHHTMPVVDPTIAPIVTPAVVEPAIDPIAAPVVVTPAVVEPAADPVVVAPIVAPLSPISVAHIEEPMDIVKDVHVEVLPIPQQTAEPLQKETPAEIPTVEQSENTNVENFSSTPPTSGTTMFTVNTPPSEFDLTFNKPKRNK